MTKHGRSSGAKLSTSRPYLRQVDNSLSPLPTQSGSSYRRNTHRLFIEYDPESAGIDRNGPGRRKRENRCGECYYTNEREPSRPSDC
jgi:hypothetical protein